MEFSVKNKMKNELRKLIKELIENGTIDGQFYEVETTIQSVLEIVMKGCTLCKGESEGFGLYIVPQEDVIKYNVEDGSGRFIFYGACLECEAHPNADKIFREHFQMALREECVH